MCVCVCSSNVFWEELISSSPLSLPDASASNSNRCPEDKTTPESGWRHINRQINRHKNYMKSLDNIEDKNHLDSPGKKSMLVKGTSWK